ncbi:MAG: hypothetical protein LBH71_02080 [Oscillospiraceae bacterium]|jgi:hypothetical protein|nr:hypothetical protein [Oscillospiraceae bacterium]
MGTFFDTIQIQNSRQTEPEQFKKILCKHLEKKGLIPVQKEDAQFSYYLAFSDNGKWVTLSSPNFEGEDAIVQARELSKSFKTVCVGTSVFDSDFARLDLFDNANKRSDTVIIGRVDEMVEDMISYQKIQDIKGSRDCWEHLIISGQTWEELSRIWRDEYVFAEQALQKTAPLLGMDPTNISADYRCFEEEPEKFNVLHLYFKTAGDGFIEEGPTKLRLYHQSFAVTGERHVVSFCNIGGVSKGVTVILVGKCFESGGVEINEMTLEKHKNPRSPQACNYGADELEILSAKAEKCKMPDGTAALRFDFNEFQFHEGLDQSHPSMKGKRGEDIFYSHGCHLRFTPMKKLAEKQYFIFAVIPQINWEAGQDSYKTVLYSTHEQRDKDLFEDFQKM